MSKEYQELVERAWPKLRERLLKEEPWDSKDMVKDILSDPSILIKADDQELPRYKKSWGNDGDGFYDCLAPHTTEDMKKDGWVKTANKEMP